MRSEGRGDQIIVVGIGGNWVPCKPLPAFVTLQVNVWLDMLQVKGDD
jgi:hypothetical protein